MKKSISNTNIENPSEKQLKKEEDADKQKNIQFKFQFLSQSRAEEAASILTQSFIHMNIMWKKLGASYNQVFSVNRGRMIACCRAGWSCMMVDPISNKIAAVSPNLDLIDYIQAKSMPNNSYFLKTLTKYASQLENQYFASLKPNLKRGQCAYSYGGAVRPEFAKGGIAKKFWSTGLLFLKVAGFKVCYSRATNRVSTKILTSFGAKVIKIVDIKQPGMQKQFLELIRFDLDQFTFDSLSKFYEEKSTDDDLQTYQ